MKLYPSVSSNELLALPPGSLVKVSVRYDEVTLFALIAGRRPDGPDQEEGRYLIFLEASEPTGRAGNFIGLNESWNQTVLSFGSNFGFGFDPSRAADVELQSRHHDLGGVMVVGADTTYIRARSADPNLRRHSRFYDINTGYFADNEVQSRVSILRWSVRLPSLSPGQSATELVSVDATIVKQPIQ